MAHEEPLSEAQAKEQIRLILQQETPIVSRETFSKLETLVEEVKRWQKAINLIAPQTLDAVWTRHILDSIQILPMALHQMKNHPGPVLDLGSGGGFPGLVLAACGLKPITLVDSDQRKCQFLAQTARKLGLSVEVEAERIERRKPQTTSLVTARALAPLAGLLDWASPHLSTQTESPKADKGQALFLKGQTWQEEVSCARELYDFDLESWPSLTNSQARLLSCRNIIKKV